MRQEYKNSLKFVWDSFSNNKTLIYIFVAGKIIEGIFYVIFPVLAKLEMDQLSEKNEQLFGIIEMNSFNIFLIILLIIFLFKLLENILKSFISLFEYDYIKLYDNYYSESLYKRLANIEPGLLLNSRNKRFIGDIIGNSSQISDYVRSIIGNFITNIFVIAGITTVLLIINFWIFLILLSSSFLIYLIEKLKEKYNEKQNFEDKYEFDEKIWILTNQMNVNLNYLITSGGFNFILDTYSKFNDSIRIRTKLLQKRNTILSIFSFIVENISDIFIKLIVGYGIFYSTTSLGTMTLSLLYISRINELFSFFRYFKFDLDRFLDSLLKLNLFLNISEKKEYKNLNKNVFSKIELINLKFSYPNFAEEELKYLEITENRIRSYSSSGDYVKDQIHIIEEARKQSKEINPIILEDINLKFELGKTYGLVGKNGVGKTSLVSLLLNFFDNYEGLIKIDDIEIKNFDRKFFINNFSVINQLPYVIDGLTIRENLLLGVYKEYSDDYIIDLLKKFGLDKKIFKNRLGLDSKIGYENDFSGGEKQLFTLIRIILQDKRVLIMDEGTNQLDAENEMLVMNELLKHKHNKIVIFITHRMTTIRKVDLIYCLEDGKISDFGNHTNLIKGKNIYSSFWKKQVEE